MEDYSLQNYRTGPILVSFEHVGANRIGDRIKQARKAAGLSLRALAERADVTAMPI